MKENSQHIELFSSKLVIVLLYMLFCVNVFAQDYRRVDLYVDQISIEDTIPFETLAFKLIKTDWNEEDKARAIFYWIAKNIEYDYSGLNSGFWSNYSSDYLIAFDTFTHRKGICSGYSHLFKKMSAKVGLEVEVINGYSRIEPKEAGFPVIISNHSWNAVRINGVWKLIDVTWAHSYGNVGEINNYYFLTPAEEFIANHYPEIEKWQLLDSAISKAEFDKYPYISSKYFELNIGEHFPKNGFIKSDNGQYQLIIDIPIQHSLLLKLYDFSKKEWLNANYSTNFNDQKGIKIVLENESEGHFLLSVGYLHQDDSIVNIYNGVLFFTLINEFSR